MAMHMECHPGHTEAYLYLANPWTLQPYVRL